jgi:capsular exopolysaccharide synthesis family protein
MVAAMSEFFKALEQAERDRALGRQSVASEVAAAEAPAALADEAPVQVLPALSIPKWPGPVAATKPVTAPVAEAAPDGVDAHMVSLVSPASFEAEQYRTLRHMIEQLKTRDGVSVIACSSPIGGDGKTTTAINLAGALAQAKDTNVLLVDADLRRPSVAHEFTLGHDQGRGLVGAVLDPDLALSDVVRQRPPYALSILPAGSAAPNPYELLNSTRFVALLDEARRQYDYVVLDTPPLVSIPDCRAIAPCVDGFLVIVSAHRTPRKLVEEALTGIDPTKLIGLVFNRDDRPLGGYYTYSYGSSNGHRNGRWNQVVTKSRGLFQRPKARRSR